MVQRWGRADIIRFVGIAIVSATVVLVAALLDTNLSRIVDVSYGDRLPTPAIEVDAVEVPSITEADLVNKTPEEIDALIEASLAARRGVDFTRSFDVAAVVNADRSVTITENIVQVFRTPRHGIERYVALRTNRGTNVMRSLVVAVSTDTPGLVDISDVEGGVRVRIGDPDQYIEGAHAYRLTYVLENVVDTNASEALVRLDAINNWGSDITSLTYRISGPTSPSSVACYLGRFGSTEACGSAEQASRTATFAAGRTLRSGEGFTAEVRYPAAAVIGDAVVTSTRGPLVAAMLAIGALFAAVVIGYVITVLRERRSLAHCAASVTLTFEGPIQSNLPNRMTRGASLPPPLAADAAIGAPVEFLPPLNLDPASMLRLRDLERVDVPAMLSATLVDLAADGVIGLERAEDGEQWVVRRIAQAPRGVTEYEKLLLTALLGDDDSCVLHERSSSIGAAIPGFVQAVDAHLRSLDVLSAAPVSFSANRRAGSLANAVMTVVSCAIASLVFIGVFTTVAEPVTMSLLFAGAAVVLIVASAILRDRRRQRAYRPRGLGAVHRIGGFERFFRDSEAIHARAAGDLGIYREYMGYAVAFDHVDTWIGAMPEQVAGSSVGAIPIVALGALAHDTTWRTASNNYASSISRSRSASSGGGGFSGGFSGGGFSGGGSGGGGGGSW